MLSKLRGFQALSQNFRLIDMPMQLVELFNLYIHRDISNNIIEYIWN